MNERGIRLSTFGLCAFLLAGTAPAALPVFAKPTSGQMRAHYIDVGQGAAVLLEFECGTAVIDTGGEKHATFDSTALLTAYLDAYFARRPDRDRTIDLLVLTHPHIDHTRATLTLLGHYTVKNLVDNGAVKGEGGMQQKLAHAKARASNGKLRHEVVATRTTGESKGRTSAIIDPINCQGTDPRISALWGRLRQGSRFSKSTVGNPNNSSVVIRLDFGAVSFLFPGDLESAVHRDLLDFYAEGCTSACPLDVDVFHVAHHAAGNGTSIAFLEAMSPRLAVISMGVPGRTGGGSAMTHGHPRLDSVVRLLDQQHGGVSDPRTGRHVQVARFSGKTRARPGEPPLGQQFVDMDMKRAVYGTGWDGTVVVTAQSTGALKVDIEK